MVFSQLTCSHELTLHIQGLGTTALTMILLMCNLIQLTQPSCLNVLYKLRPKIYGAKLKCDFFYTVYKILLIMDFECSVAHVRFSYNNNSDIPVLLWKIANQ